MNNERKIFLIAGILIFSIFSIFYVMASVINSSNYAFNAFSVSDGGGNATSTNYKMHVSSNVIAGEASSEEYKNNIGFIGTSLQLDSCLNFSGCKEDENCSINFDCFLDNNLCSDNICNFKNLTIGADVYVFHDNSGNGGNLTINLSGKIMFNTGNKFIFSGKRLSRGGNAGVVNISVADLFNTTSAVFTGVGGYSTASGNSGGDGGVLQINYWGLIRNFNYGGASVNLSGGDSLDSGFGTSRTIIYNKDTSKLINGARDVDISGDGRVTSADILLITNRYNNISTDSTFSNVYDINNDDELDVADLARIGLQWATR